MRYQTNFFCILQRIELATSIIPFHGLTFGLSEKFIFFFQNIPQIKMYNYFLRKIKFCRDICSKMSFFINASIDYIVLIKKYTLIFIIEFSMWFLLLLQQIDHKFGAKWYATVFLKFFIMKCIKPVINVVFINKETLTIRKTYL